MSTFNNYVPWRSRDSSTSYSGGGGTKTAPVRSASVTERTPTSATSTLARKERDAYAGLSNYRPPASTNVRGPLSSNVRERVSQVDLKYGGGNSGSGSSGGGSSTLGKYTRSYSSERTPSSELASTPTKTLELASPVKEKPSSVGSFRTSRYGSAYTPPETPTLRLGSSARFGGQIARSPLTDKSSAVFGVSGPLSPTRTEPVHYNSHQLQQQSSQQDNKKDDKTITLVTRSTSPTPPCNSSFLRAKRADMEATVVVEVPRPHFRPVCIDREAQADEKECSRNTSCISPPPPAPTRLSSWANSRLSSINSVAATPRYTPRLPTYSSYSRPTDLPLRTSSYKSEPEPKQLSVPRVSEETKPKPKPDVKEKTDEPTPKTRPEPAQPVKPKSPVPPADTKTQQNKPDENETSRNEKTKTKVTDDKEKVKKSPSGAKLKKSESTKTLPPPVPKTEPTKNNIINKDFRKSTLNMDLSSSGESLDARKVGAEKSKSKSNVNKALKKSSSKLKVSPSAPKLTLDAPKSSKGPQITKKIPLSESDSSEDESSSESSESSEESSEEEKAKNPNPNLLTVSSKSHFSSAEEGSVSAEKPPKPPLSPRLTRKLDNHRNDEPKAVVVRTVAAPAPVVMKVKYPGGGTTSSSTEDISEKSNRSRPSLKDKPKTSSSEGTDDQPSKQYVLRKFDSGEVAWWMESNKDIPSLAKSVSKKSINETELGPKKDASNKSLSSEEPISEEVFVQSTNFTPGLNRIHQKLMQERPFPITYKIRKMDSGERAWWMESTNDVPGLQETEESNESAKSTEESKKSENLKPVAGLKKNKSSKSLLNLQKTESTNSISGIPKSDNFLQVPGAGQPVENKEPQLKKTASMKSIPGLQRVPSSKSIGELKKNASCKSLPMLVRSDSRKSLKESGGSSGREGDSSSSELTSSSRREYPRVGYRMCRIESGDREWWLDEEEKTSKKRIKKKDGQVFVGNFINIDHVLGNLPPPPSAIRTPRDTASEDSDSGNESGKVIAKGDVKVHDSTAKNAVLSPPRGMIKLDDTALQLYKDGDYGAYLDLEASIDEQQEEFDSFNTNRKNAIVLRTQLSVRVHTIIEKLLNSEGRDLRRALFSLKQIFQEDKDLVHEFVQNDGLACLIRVGTDADQNHQNYILRALGQIMLYVDGMNGVIDHPSTVQWLYSLVASKFRLVVKTALKLLLVFVEYVETNCILLVKAVRAVDYVHSTRPWSNIMKLMKEYDAADTELLIYAMSLINKTLNGLPDQDMYYDQVDALEEQGLESVIRRYMAKQGTDLDLLRQFQIYEAVLQHEDGDEKGTPLRQLDETIRKALRNRKSLTATLNPVERRKSRRNSTGNSPLTITLTPTRPVTQEQVSPPENVVNGEGVTPSVRRRRERAERQRSFIREQREATLRAQLSSSDQSTSDDGLPNGNCAVTSNGHSLHNGVENHNDAGSQHCREGSVKDLTQKLATTLNSPGDESKLLGGPFGDMKGIISKAKEGLAKSQSRGDVLKSPTGEMPPRIPEVKKTETDLHWEELLASSTRELCLCDLDFRDLGSDDERDILAPTNNVNGIPPPPPPCGAPPPAPIPSSLHPLPPPSLPFMNQQNNKTATLNSTPPAKKTKKTVKLFWKEVRDDPIIVTKMNSGRLLWDELSPVQIDTQKLEHLFESRAKDLITKKQQEMNKNKEIIVLDPKRSNAINIGMTKLPPPRSIKTAILKMDATVMNREGIEKLLTMLPSEEERSKIQEAQAANPDLPLGSAEQFLLTLASISELDARLKLWAFKLDYENSEKEIAEPLMDLKQGMETLKVNRSFRAILGTLLSIGIFLNGTEVKGFQIEYLSKVPEVKDTVHKHSLLHHLCYMVMEKFPDSTDLYSEIGAVTRASKVDFEELSGNIQKMEQECKSSFDHLKIISKHDGTTNMKLKMSDFLADCAERIIVLSKVHRRIINRYHKFCMWLGIPLHRVSTIKPNDLCRIISEFALEYRTTRERVLQQLEKKASHRERNKTRGKMITEVGKFRSQEDRADAELKELLGNEKLDKPANNTIHGSLPWRRTRKEPVHSPVDGTNGNLTDGDDEILETLVKTATKTPVSRTTPRERKRTRNADRKSLIKRSRTRENVHCEGRH